MNDLEKDLLEKEEQPEKVDNEFYISIAIIILYILYSFVDLSRQFELKEEFQGIQHENEVLKEEIIKLKLHIQALYSNCK
jgi:hypothetical protein